MVERNHDSKLTINSLKSNEFSPFNVVEWKLAIRLRVEKNVELKVVKTWRKPAQKSFENFYKQKSFLLQHILISNFKQFSKTKFFSLLKVKIKCDKMVLEIDFQNYA